MLQGWVIIVVSFAYLGLLFAIAYYADQRADAGARSSPALHLQPFARSLRHCMDLSTAVSAGPRAMASGSCRSTSARR